MRINGEGEGGERRGGEGGGGKPKKRLINQLKGHRCFRFSDFGLLNVSE